jgi:hypothetical protein
MVPVNLERVAAERPYRVWVTQADQGVVEVSGPQVINDTLVGYIGGVFTELPATDVKQVKVKRSAKGKTMALVAASIVGAGALGVVISGLGSSGRDPGVDCMDVPDDPRCLGMTP